MSSCMEQDGTNGNWSGTLNPASRGKGSRECPYGVMKMKLTHL